MSDEIMSPEEREALERDRVNAQPTTKPLEKPIKPQRPTSNGSYLPDIHRLLPQSGDAEQGVLSSILLLPGEVIELCYDKGLTAEWFHIPAHKTIFTRLIEMYEKRTPIDVITLTAYLRDTKEIDEVGGPAFVTDLFTFLPTAANAEYYIALVEEKYTLRSIIQVGTEFAARGYDEQGEVTSLLDEFETRAMEIAEKRYAKENILAGPKDAVMEAIRLIEDMYANKGKINGIPTGFQDLDMMLDGLKAEFYVIGARPSMGKTAFAMNIAEHVAIEQKKPVGVFSLEMSKAQLVQRLLCTRARIDITGVRNGMLDEKAFPRITKCAGEIAHAEIYIDDTASLTIQQLRSKARRMKRQYKIEALFIDYLQLLKSSSRKAQTDRQIEVSEISGGLKALSKELGIPIVVLAQLKREAPMADGKVPRPRLSDLKESGSIEQDADTVMFISRDEYYLKDADERAAAEGQASIIIAKQRNGPTGDVQLTFQKEYTKFSSKFYGEEEQTGDGQIDFGL